jgi:predicted ribosome quality control (RQC) complex YloA/Tae2 family protein
MKLQRPIKWFEKFFWFISSEGFLVLGARETQQADLLVRRYFRRGDVYVHSDLEGSIVVVVKNGGEGVGVPPGTISQAGVMAVATSRAWDVKQGTTPKPPKFPT